jgi:hypothetical protein
MGGSRGCRVAIGSVGCPIYGADIGESGFRCDHYTCRLTTLGEGQFAWLGHRTASGSTLGIFTMDEGQRFRYGAPVLPWTATPMELSVQRRVRAEGGGR